MAVSTMGLLKAAVVLVSLDQAQAAEVLRRLPRDLALELVRQVGNLEAVDATQRRSVLEQVVATLDAHSEIVEGGWDVARRILEQAYGTQRAAEVLRQLTAGFGGAKPFAFLSRMDTLQLTQLLLPELPQAVAVVLVHADPGQAADVLAAFPRDRAADIVRRMARLAKVPPPVLAAMERELESRLSTAAPPDATGGVDLVVPVLNAADPKAEREILEVLAQRDPELAEQIQGQLFTFADIVRLDDDAVQLILRRVELPTLALALKTVGPAVLDKVQRNLSERQNQVLQEEIDRLGRVRVRDVEQAQREITHVIHALEEAGDLALPHGGEEDQYV